MGAFCGENLKKIRENRGLTQKQLADKLNIASSTVGMYEQGRRQPDLNTLIKMSDKLLIPISMLIKTKYKLNIKSIQIDEIIIELINFIQNQDCVYWKDKKLSTEKINNILYFLNLLLKIEKRPKN